MRQGFLTSGGLSHLLIEPVDCHTYRSNPSSLLQLFIKLGKISQENCIFHKFSARIYNKAELVLVYT
ncbi:hypothetical protein Osc7112_0895 [Oscillatoria nigro-viridis PCC 7112]|uniref:Uncharacterized protein n=1 Tax=Phormidium nigroviride PCC 7112 TaxID=179408 RepID=K9VDC6_9CYAN|nr:hypothetical protein Osc7112_0895 [Oscillatoria nigro-viridis PCC 7112]